MAIANTAGGFRLSSFAFDVKDFAEKFRLFLLI
jgi:hypothetical protein